MHEGKQEPAPAAGAVEALGPAAEVETKAPVADESGQQLDLLFDGERESTRERRESTRGACRTLLGMMAFFPLACVLGLSRLALVLVYLLYYYYGTRKSLAQLATEWAGDHSLVAQQAIAGAMGVWAVEFVWAATFNGALTKLSVEGSFSRVWNRTIGLLIHRLRRGPTVGYRVKASLLLFGHSLNVVFWVQNGARLYLLLLGELVKPDGDINWLNASTPAAAQLVSTDLSTSVMSNVGMVLFALAYGYVNVLWSSEQLLANMSDLIERMRSCCARRCQKAPAASKLPAESFLGEPDADYWPALTRAEKKLETCLRRIVSRTGNRRTASEKEMRILLWMRHGDRVFVAGFQFLYYWGAMTHTANLLAGLWNISEPNPLVIQPLSGVCSLSTTAVSALFYFVCQSKLRKSDTLLDVFWRRFYVSFPQKASAKKPPKKARLHCDYAMVGTGVLLSTYTITILSTVAFQAFLFLQSEKHSDSPGEHLVNDQLASLFTWIYLNAGVTLGATLCREAYVLPPKLWAVLKWMYGFLKDRCKRGARSAKVQPKQTELAQMIFLNRLNSGVNPFEEDSKKQPLLADDGWDGDPRVSPTFMPSPPRGGER